MNSSFLFAKNNNNNNNNNNNKNSNNNEKSFYQHYKKFRYEVFQKTYYKNLNSIASEFDDHTRRIFSRYKRQ